nr:RNA-directed DNA polymerase, eukaryota [Tanacetum cinerariifolium]
MKLRLLVDGSDLDLERCETNPMVHSSKWAAAPDLHRLASKFVTENVSRDKEKRFSRLSALESHKRIDVAAKLAHSSVAYSFRRAPRSVFGRFGYFSVASVRKLIDDKRLPDVSSKTRWIKAVPIKVNVHAWKVRLDNLPTRLNISRRGMDIASIFCHICGNAMESSRHLFFDFHVAKDLFRKISRWWDLSYMEVSSYDEIAYVDTTVYVQTCCLNCFIQLLSRMCSSSYALGSGLTVDLIEMLCNDMIAIRILFIPLALRYYIALLSHS